ncbi:hypothetical protein MLD38_025065 [Melastoma candidum]|uniref:Uncharacterized protein n=1 Tax=Melastoma candidum TaxID=119954 RepID=A0ACB9NVK0_9MYRT|nr:hypothetical protein MLD38_025065 [Melastoma candidum]
MATMSAATTTAFSDLASPVPDGALLPGSFDYGHDLPGLIPRSDLRLMQDEALANAQRDSFDLGEFVGDLTFEDDAGSTYSFSASDFGTLELFLSGGLVWIFFSDDLSLEGLQLELEECKDDDVVANILSNGVKLREHT